MGNYLLFICGSDIDYFYDVEAFLGPSDACFAKYDDKKVGGCILNAACVASSLGSNVKFLDYLKKDDDDTKLLNDTLNSYDVDTSLIKYGDDVSNGKCIILKKDNEKCIYVIKQNKPYFDKEDYKYLKEAKLIYSSMHLLKESFKDLDIFKDTNLYLDASSQYNDEDDIKIIRYAKGIFLNDEAYKRLIKKTNINILKELLNDKLEFACVTNGSKGCDLYLKEEIIHEDSQKVIVVDSTGAGDSFAGCFIHFMDKGKSLRECLKYASYCGSYACLKLGGLAGAIKEKELFKYMGVNYDIG